MVGPRLAAEGTTAADDRVGATVVRCDQTVAGPARGADRANQRSAHDVQSGGIPAQRALRNPRVRVRARTTAHAAAAAVPTHLARDLDGWASAADQRRRAGQGRARSEILRVFG